VKVTPSVSPSLFNHLTAVVTVYTTKQILRTYVFRLKLYHIVIISLKSVNCVYSGDGMCSL